MLCSVDVDFDESLFLLDGDEVGESVGEGEAPHFVRLLLALVQLGQDAELPVLLHVGLQEETHLPPLVLEHENSPPRLPRPDEHGDLKGLVELPPNLVRNVDLDDGEGAVLVTEGPRSVL